jgi:hypothetical protein
MPADIMKQERNHIFVKKYPRGQFRKKQLRR